MRKRESINRSNSQTILDVFTKLKSHNWTNFQLPAVTTKSIEKAGMFFFFLQICNLKPTTQKTQKSKQLKIEKEIYTAIPENPVIVQISQIPPELQIAPAPQRSKRASTRFGDSFLRTLQVKNKIKKHKYNNNKHTITRSNITQLPSKKNLARKNSNMVQFQTNILHFYLSTPIIDLNLVAHQRSLWSSKK